MKLYIRMASDINPDELPELEYLGDTHPAPAMLMLRDAIESGLSDEQRQLWNLWAYDKLTQAQLAEKLNISQQAVSQRIKTIECVIARWCKKNMPTYKPLFKSYDKDNR